jgi:hypothetical protein
MKLQISPEGRNIVTSSGEPIFLVADTAWALPFRATLEEVTLYAKDRQSKGFNAALLMVIQPDMQAEGPEDRKAPHGFARAFEDLPLGHLRKRNEAYFEHLDKAIEILRDHGIIPLLTPLFYGFGWQGKNVIGPVADPEEAVAFATFLVQRYDQGPAIWLVGADGTGWEPAVGAMGQAIRKISNQPIGIHYNPWQSNDAHWDEPWCDFHLCQSGHDGQHRPEMVATMAARPGRGVANGEPTYEGMSGGKNALGTWQSEEAWLNVTCGGTMGVFYGAASLWQWRREGETIWGEWCAGPWDWKGALDLEGSNYPGIVRKALDGLQFQDMTRSVLLARGKRCVANEHMALIYLPRGGSFHFGATGTYRVLNAQTGVEVATGVLTKDHTETHMGQFVELPHGQDLCVAIRRSKRP